MIDMEMRISFVPAIKTHVINSIHVVLARNAKFNVFQLKKNVPESVRSKPDIGGELVSSLWSSTSKELNYKHSKGSKQNWNNVEKTILPKNKPR